MHRRASTQTLISADSFDRADSSTSVGTTDGNGTADPVGWVNQFGVFGITSNQAKAVSTPARATVDLGTADVDILVLRPLDINTTDGIVFRWTDNSNYWGFVKAVGHMFLFKFQAGSNIGQTMITNPAQLAGDTIRVVAKGDSIVCLLNQTLCASVSDSFNNTATKHGLYTQSGALLANFDNWKVYVPQ